MQNLFARNDERLGKASLPAIITGIIVFALAIAFDQKIAAIVGQIALWSGLLLGYRRSSKDAWTGTRCTLYTSTVDRNEFVTFNEQGWMSTLATAVLYAVMSINNQNVISLIIACIFCVITLTLFFMWKIRMIWFGWRVFLGI